MPGRGGDRGRVSDEQVARRIGLGGRDDGAEIAVAGQTPDGKEQANNSINHFFRRQTKAAICYAKGGSQVPTLPVGCRLESAGDKAVDLTTARGYAGVSLVDCVIALPPGGPMNSGPPSPSN